jgi:hypothetical protein
MAALTSRNSPIKCLLWLDELNRQYKEIFEIADKDSESHSSDLLWVFHYNVGHEVSHKHTVFFFADDELMSEKELKESSVICC